MEQPEEKAKELVEKFRAYSMTYFNEVEGIFDEESEIKNAKQCALIAVKFALEAIRDCSVVAGYPLDEYENLKNEINKL